MYKLYQSKKYIPWVNGSGDDAPFIGIQDEYFNFELVPSNNFKFETWDSGYINVDSKDITYFKLVNEITNESTYWYVSSISRVLSQGYTLRVNIDLIMTYIRDLFSKWLGEKAFPLLERVSFTKNMIDNEPLRKSIYYAFNLDDEILSNTEFAPKGIETVESRVINGEFPWKVRTYENLTTWNVVTFDFKPQTDVSKQGKTFTYNLGIYCVMLNNSGSYDLIPVNDYVIEGSKNGLKKPWNRIYIDNKVEDIITYAVNRKRLTSQTNGEQDLPSYNENYYIGVGGIKGIENHYSSNAFQGFYKAPIIFTDNTKEWKSHMWSYRYETNAVDNNKYNIYMMVYLNHHPNNPIQFTIPKTFEIKDDLIDTYIELCQPIIYSQNELKPAKYFSHLEFEYKNRPRFFDIYFSLVFMGGFIGAPRYNEFMTEEHMISFGKQLPSASNEYAENLKKIQQTFDVGRTNAIIGAVQGAPSAAGKWAASGTWGIASTIGSALTVVRDFYNLQTNKRNSIINASNSFINSTTSDWFYFNTYFGVLLKIPNILDNHYGSGVPERPNQKEVYDVAIQKLFSESQKKQLYFILSKYGFKYNMCLDLTEWYGLLEKEDVVYMKFNDVWVAHNINKTLPLDIQDAIVNKLANGIRIHMGVQ